MAPLNVSRNAAIGVACIMAAVALSGIVAMLIPTSSTPRPSGRIVSAGLVVAPTPAAPPTENVRQRFEPLLPLRGDFGWEASDIADYGVETVAGALPQQLRCSYLNGAGFSLPLSYFEIESPTTSVPPIRGMSVVGSVANMATVGPKIVADLYGCDPGPTGSWAWGKPGPVNEQKLGSVTVRRWSHPVEFAPGKFGVAHRAILLSSTHFQVMSVVVPDQQPKYLRTQAATAQATAIKAAVSKMQLAVGSQG